MNEETRLQAKIDELERRVACYQEDQRVSSESFNFHYKRLLKAQADLDFARKTLLTLRDFFQSAHNFETVASRSPSLIQGYKDIVSILEKVLNDTNGK